VLAQTFATPLADATIIEAAAYREAVIKTLRILAEEITTPGSDLNLLVTGGGK